MIRTHNCGELTKNDISSEVTLSGWIASRRDHGEIIFMDLRDKHGVTQLVFDPDRNKEAHDKAHELRNEYCVNIAGKVSARPEGTVNPNIKTGEVVIDDRARYLGPGYTVKNLKGEVISGFSLRKGQSIEYKMEDGKLKEIVILR